MDKNRIGKIIFGEFIGTMLFLIIALGSVAQLVLGGGSFFDICIAFAIGAAIGIYAAKNLSGGHVNPAATLALCITGRAEWAELGFYWIGQYLGAFAAAAVVFVTYIEGIASIDPDHTVPLIAYNETTGTPTAGIFATYPKDILSNGICFFDQIVGTFMLVMSILAVTDARHKISADLAPIFIGLSIGAVGLSFGWNCGFSLNPARDLGPR